MKWTLNVLIAGCCLALASATSAQTVPNPMPNPQLPQPGQVGQQPPPQMQFGQAPPNLQGAQNAAAMNAFLLKNFDRDGDGKLNAQEKLMGTRALQERGYRVPGMPNLVRGDNGPISNQPFPQQPQQQQKKLTRREEILLKRFDKDGDGQLNDEEKEAARAELGQKNKADKK